MTALTLPRVMTRSEFGWPLYGYRLLLDSEVFTSVPFLPNRLGARWETADEAGAGCEELTAGIWAQLWYLSPIDPGRVSDAEAVEAADRVLMDRMCDLAVCAGEVEGDLADHPGSYARWSGCLKLAARLVGTVA